MAAHEIQPEANETTSNEVTHSQLWQSLLDLVPRQLPSAPDLMFVRLVGPAILFGSVANRLTDQPDLFEYFIQVRRSGAHICVGCARCFGRATRERVPNKPKANSSVYSIPSSPTYSKIAPK
jgi:hypothetical protein